MNRLSRRTERVALSGVVAFLGLVAALFLPRAVGPSEPPAIRRAAPAALRAPLASPAPGASPQATAGAHKADRVLLNGRIYTVEPQQPWAEAIAIRGQVILAVGSNAEIAALAGPRTEQIDLGGRIVLPGLVDSHIHFLSGSLGLTQANLEGAATIEEMQRRIQHYARAHPGRGWILGRGWVYSSFAPSNLPHRKFLDEVVPDRPILLEAYDGHTVWVNSRALERAGITRATPDPPNGVIVRDAQDEPTGALKEDAQDLVYKVVPEPSRAEKLAALRRGLAEANRLGLTSIVNASGTLDDLALYAELRRRGQLTLRTYTALLLKPGMSEREFHPFEQARGKYRSAWVRAGLVKGFVDGVIESHTAAMLAPYSDDPSQQGKLNYSPEELTRLVRELDRRGFQVMLHAIGDRGVRTALDAFEGAAGANPTRRDDRRFRIEHIETIDAADAPRFGRQGVIASFQPLHCYPDTNLETVWARNVGPQRLPRSFAWRDVAAAGGRLAFGSDWAVVTLNPFAGMQNAVTRKTTDGQPAGGWVGHQAVSLEQTIRAYTLDAAYAQFREEQFGSLKAGKWADLVVLTHNPFEIPRDQIRKVQAHLTIVGGRIVYRAEPVTGR